MKLKAVMVLAVLMVVGTAYGTGYPKPKPLPNRFVQDFAHIIPDQEEARLEQRLEAYEMATSIEIAVVTVTSLEGETIEMYTVDLAESWGVGKKNKDNGIVFLTAPNERATRIEVGYGLEPDLTDLRSHRIIEEQIIPHFKEGKFPEGISAGVEGILAALGEAPYATRLAEREVQRQANITARTEAGKLFGIIVLSFCGIVFVVGLFVRRSARKDQQKKNKEKLARVIGMMGRVRSQGYVPIAANLGRLQEKSPKSVWQEFAETLMAYPGKLDKLNEEIKRLSRKNSVMKDLDNVADELVRIEESLTLLLLFPKRLQEKNEAVLKAREEAKVVAARLPEHLTRVREKVSQPAYTSKALEQVDAAQRTFEKARAFLSARLVDWIALLATLKVIEASLHQATEMTKENEILKASKEAAERAVAKRHREEEEDRRWRQSQSDSSSPTSYGSSGSSSGSGGFGGGSFGGGGSSGKW